MTSEAKRAGADATVRDEPVARVLVVDDERSVIELFQDFLSVQGYELQTATTGEDGVRALKSMRPDVILTDINLPGMSGLQVMREAKRVDPEVAVIVVTGHASAASAIDALRQGAYDYITKPFDLDEVNQIVERALANRRLRALNRQLVEELRQKNEILRNHEQELRERVELATWQMTRLYEVGKEISANLELVPRLDVIAEKAAELSSSAAAVVCLKHEEGGEFRAASSAGVELQPGDDGRPAALSPDDPVWAVVESQRPLRLDAPKGRVLQSLPDGAFGCALAAPMIAEGQVMGVLTVLGKEDGYTDDDESFIMLFASQIAIAVRNSQLFDHTKSLDRLKSEFVAVVSHEIRTPLTSVKGAVELLSDGRFFQNNDQQSKLLTIAHANAERLLVLINDILDFSKLEAASLPMNMERQRLEPVVHQATHNLRTQLEERRIHLDLALASDLPDVLLDANRVAQVLTNLLSNAIKFSPHGGRIEVTADRWEEGVRVGVRDHGEGIAPEDLPKLFRKFSQIDSSATRQAGGTGLGLVICKGIVEQHGGDIWVESTLGEGSTFYFTMPAHERAATEVPAEQQA